MNNLNEQKAVYTVTEAAQYLGLASSTLNKWRCLGGGPVYLKLGRSVRYRLSDLDNFATSRQCRSTVQYGEMVINN